MKIISWYAHKEKGNKKDEKLQLDKSPTKNLFKIKKNRKENAEDLKE